MTVMNEMLLLVCVDPIGYTAVVRLLLRGL